jgi:hypothetical protein
VFATHCCGTANDNAVAFAANPTTPADPIAISTTPVTVAVAAATPIAATTAATTAATVAAAVSSTDSLAYS